MGGTSTDVCLIEGTAPDPSPSLAVAGYPVRLPAVGIHTIGAGGGSLATIDAGGALSVGPRSAGAVPGPACYGLGGSGATVTDADLVLGRIPSDAAFAGLGCPHLGPARAALDRAGVQAEDVITVVDAAMAGALRAVSVERGVDPSRLALVAFGGAGPLHACALADTLGMSAVIVPARAGAFSAVGLLAAPEQRDLVCSWPTPDDHQGLAEAAAELAAKAARLLAGSATAAPTTTVMLDCRYRGQGHELTVASVADFHAEHRRRNGYARTDDPVEVVAIRARAVAPSPVALGSLPATSRKPVAGPVVLAEPDCTIWVPSSWRADVGEAGAYVLRRMA
jgi:N-methylhydantoinase A/oxoprolinase/acetone carboxylase beta subunit